MRKAPAEAGGDSPAARVRVDKWLWAARFFKTRGLAAEAIARGQVRIGGERIKVARDVRVGETMVVWLNDEPVDVVVLGLSDVRGPAPVARALYAETAESAARREARRAQRRHLVEPAAALKGRPTKRDGRALRRARDDGAL